MDLPRISWGIYPTAATEVPSIWTMTPAAVCWVENFLLWCFIVSSGTVKFVEFNEINTVHLQCLPNAHKIADKNYLGRCFAQRWHIWYATFHCHSLTMELYWPLAAQLEKLIWMAYTKRTYFSHRNHEILRCDSISTKHTADSSLTLHPESISHRSISDSSSSMPFGWQTLIWIKGKAWKEKAEETCPRNCTTKPKQR